MVNVRPRPPAFLSKTKYLEGLQCPKLLWYEYNRKQDIPEIDARAQAIMEEGLRVGRLAQELFPGGLRIEREYIPERHAEKSLKTLALRNPLFEAGFVYKRGYALADILEPVSKNRWNLIEVKSSTSIKDHHLYDVAFQKHIYEGAGIKIHRCYLMHINNQYVKKGEIEPKKLFSKQDITKEASNLSPEIKREMALMLRIISSKKMPDIKIGPHCSDPYPCPLEDICWDFLPEKDDIFTLYGGGKRALEFMRRGILKITDIPYDFGLSNRQLIQINSHKKRKPYVDRVAIKGFLERLEYPLYFLDFETMSFAIPPYDLSRPYENIPFQYSLYVIKRKGARPDHYSYLAAGDSDPRPKILKQLKELLGNKGTILAYNAGFEINTLKRASEAYTQFRSWFNRIERRFVDLLKPFRRFRYYHPHQAGSASLKAVLPAITKESYKGMEIADGGTASAEYCRVTFNKDVVQKDRQRVYAALRKYCDLDTKGMIKIVGALKKMSA